jgi:hypothetical protein
MTAIGALSSFRELGEENRGLRSGRATDTKGFSRKCLASAFTRQSSSGFLFAVAGAPAALGMTEGEGIAEIDDIARDRRDRKILPLITRIALIFQ